MYTEPITVIQDLRIFAVEQAEAGLRVDLIGADARIGSILYELFDGESPDEHVRTLEAWRESGMSVTYVATGASVGLVDERALFARALGQEATP